MRCPYLHIRSETEYSPEVYCKRLQIFESHSRPLLPLMKERIRIAAGQGFWGDLLEAPVRQVEEGPIDYLMLDYLAEVTMSIMQKQRSRDASAGYARDFVPLMKRILPTIVVRDIKVIAN